MDNEYVLQVANEAKRQLVTLTPMNVLMSWGVEKFYAMEYKEMPCLALLRQVGLRFGKLSKLICTHLAPTFRVNGRLFKGEALVCLNWSDYYEVYLRNENGTRLVNDAVCFDELCDVIDVAVESGTDKAAYEAFCMSEKRKLFSGDFA